MPFAGLASKQFEWSVALHDQLIRKTLPQYRGSCLARRDDESVRFVRRSHLTYQSEGGIGRYESPRAHKRCGRSRSYQIVMQLERRALRHAIVLLLSEVHVDNRICRGREAVTPERSWHPTCSSLRGSHGRAVTFADLQTGPANQYAKPP